LGVGGLGQGFGFGMLCLTQTRPGLGDESKR
jgi:hypothetical protein